MSDALADELAPAAKFGRPPPRKVRGPLVKWGKDDGRRAVPFRPTTEGPKDVEQLKAAMAQLQLQRDAANTARGAVAGRAPSGSSSKSTSPCSTSSSTGSDPMERGVLRDLDAQLGSNGGRQRIVAAVQTGAARAVAVPPERARRSPPLPARAERKSSGRPQWQNADGTEAAAAARSTRGGKTEAERDLVSSMAARLARAEKLASSAQGKLAESEKKKKQLRRQLLRAQEAHEDVDSIGHDLAKENIRLRKRLYEMEQFLSEYGMVFVGDDSAQATSGKSNMGPQRSAAKDSRAVVKVAEIGEGVWSNPSAEQSQGTNPAGANPSRLVPAEPAPVAAAAAAAAPAPAAAAPAAASDGITSQAHVEAEAAPRVWSQRISMEKIAKSVHELNYLAGDGVEGFEKVEDAQGGAMRVKRKEALPVTIYRNGILVRQGPFRAFDDDSNGARQFVRDLQDGFFPYELKFAFPTGVPLTMTDKLGEDWVRADGPAGNIRGMVSVEQHRGPEQTKAFLNRLPDKVVRDGRIIDVKAGLLDGGDDAPKKEGPPTPGVDLDKLREERLKRFG